VTASLSVHGVGRGRRKNTFLPSICDRGRRRGEGKERGTSIRLPRGGGGEGPFFFPPSGILRKGGGGRERGRRFLVC